MINISIKNAKQSHTESALTNSVMLGRRSSHGDARAIVIDDDYASRSHLRVKPLGSMVLLTNVSTQHPVYVQHPRRVTLEPQTEEQFPLPVTVRLGRTTAKIQNGLMPDDKSSMGMTTIGAPIQAITSWESVIVPEASPDTETLTNWFERLITIQNSAAGSDLFFQQSAQAVVDLVQLDCGLVLLRSDNSWKNVAQYPNHDQMHVEPSAKILRQVIEQRRTFFEMNHVEASESLAGVDSVVASPVFDAKSDQVTGAVYGVRYADSGRGTGTISPLEAQLVQVLAAAVGAGLSRQHEELEAARKRVQFEQFVSPEVVRELDRNPDLLEGQDTEISILFADIRNFSTMSERLGARKLCELVRSIMERLANCVRSHQGTTVSYLGDGLLAMWNAPVGQKHHAELACRAALAMSEELPAIDAEWCDTVGGPLGIGIGINTGRAMVGNTGSRMKPQYGPLGDSVNLASRVEGATKKLGIPILITGQTRQQIGDAFATRRLCSVRVVGKSEAVDLYELHSSTATPEWEERRDRFESALSQFESGQWDEVCATVFPLLKNTDGTNDGPSLCLISRSVDCLNSPPPVPFDPVWNLISK